MEEKIKYDVFISYSRKDYVDENKNVIPGNEVSKIKDCLKKAGISYWFDEDGIYSGDEFARVIVKSIKASRIFVFLSTANSNKSEWTASEISSAYMLKKIIIPVRIDDSVYHDDVLLYISRLNHIDYKTNPQKGRQELVRSIKGILAEERIAEEQRQAEEKNKQAELERKRKEMEEDKKRLEQIELIEKEISALEAQRIEYEKIVLQKEQELKLAQVDLNACEKKINKLQVKLENLHDSTKSHVTKIDVMTPTQSVHKEKPLQVSHIVTKKSPTKQIQQKRFSSKAEVFQYVKDNSHYPSSLSNKDSVRSVDWFDFTAKLHKDYGIVITDKRGISNIKELVDLIWRSAPK